MTSKNHNFLSRKSVLLIWLLLINLFVSIILCYDNYALILDHFNLFSIADRKILSEEEITSYHEAGHTLIALLYPQNVQVEYVTIKPSGNTLGHTLWKNLSADNEIQILIALGGYASQSLLSHQNKIPLSEAKSGCGHDFKRVKQIIKAAHCSPHVVKSLQKKSEYLLSKNKIALDEIAQKLFIYKFLSSEDLQSILIKYPLKK